MRTVTIILLGLVVLGLAGAGGLLYRIAVENERIRRSTLDIHERLEGVDRRLEGIERRLETLEAGPGPERRGAVDDGLGTYLDTSEAALDWNRVVRVVARRGTNEDGRVVPIARLVEVLGMPAPDLTQDCKPPESPVLVENLERVDLGPFRLRMIRPAAASIREIFARVAAEEPELYALLGSAGGLCVRMTRGSVTVPSRHSFGIAVDITVNGRLDRRGDGLTQTGLDLLADYFFDAGWYWGASFRIEDSMHFEAGRDLFESWVAAGLLTPPETE